MIQHAAHVASPFPEQALPPWRRAVLKVGSSLLAADGGGLSPRHALGLAQFVSANVLAGREVVIVSSGAVAAGRAILPRADEPGAAMAARQALAALGQAQLIGLWQRFFERPVAQVLLTHDDLRNRRRYLNARATLNELLRLGALPVVNENDTVSVDELKLGDNDNLAATVAALVDADALFIATDIDGLYSADPRTVADARPLHDVPELGDEVLAMRRPDFNDAAVQPHRDFLDALQAQGKLQLTGGFADGSGGAYVLCNVDSLAQAQAIVATDPLVTMQASDLTVHEWNTR